MFQKYKYFNVPQNIPSSTVLNFMPVLDTDFESFPDWTRIRKMCKKNHNFANNGPVTLSLVPLQSFPSFRWQHETASKTFPNVTILNWTSTYIVFN